MNNPWALAAQSYGNDLNQGIQIQQQGINQAAQLGNSIYDRFINGYMQQKQMKMQEDQLARQNRLADIQQQRADEIYQRDRALQTMNFMDKWNREGSAANVEGFRSLAKRLGPDFEAVIPGDTSVFKPEESLGNVDGMEITTPGVARIGIKPEGTLLTLKKAEAEQKASKDAATLLLKSTLGKQKLEIDRAYRQWQMDPKNPRSQKALAQAEEAHARTQKLMDEHDAGLVDSVVARNYASASNSNAQAGLAGVRAGNADMSDSEKEAARAEREQARDETRKEIAAGKKKKKPTLAEAMGATPGPTPKNPPASALEKAKAEFNALPEAERTPEKKAEIKRKYGLI